MTEFTILQQLTKLSDDYTGWQRQAVLAAKWAIKSIEYNTELKSSSLICLDTSENLILTAMKECELSK